MNLICNLIIISSMILTVIAPKSSRLHQTEDTEIYAVKLSVKPIGPTAFDVEWRLLPHTNIEVHYFLTYSSQLTNEIKLMDSNNATLTDLTECTAYTIAVQCLHGIIDDNKFGPFASSIALTSHESQLETVMNLTVVTSSHSVLIVWENPVEQNLCVAYYHVSLTSTQGVGQEIQTESNHYLMRALEPCVTYYGYVCAVDFTGIKGNPVLFNVTTDSKTPGSVSNLSAFSNASKSIFVSWGKPINSSYCVHQYEVIYCYHNTSDCSTISTQANSITIPQLKPCVTYRITVTPKMANTAERGLSAKIEATVISEILEKPMNGRVSHTTNFTATLQWDPPSIYECNLIHQIINCSYLNNSIEMIKYEPNQVIMKNLKPFTKYRCYSTFFNEKGCSAKSDEITFWTKMTIPDPPTNLSIVNVFANRIVLTWADPATNLSASISDYRWTVTFKKFSYEIPKYCAIEPEYSVTYHVKNYHTYQYEIKNLKPSSSYFIELSAATESGFGNSTNITVHTLSSASSAVENLKVTSIQSNLVVLSWRYPCAPGGKVAFFHSTLVGERLGFDNHIFSVKHDISENETEFKYTINNVLPEYRYLYTVAAITYNVETPGQDKRIHFITPSSVPDRPTKYDTYRRLRVTVSENHLTQVRLSVPRALFSNANGKIQYYSIIVYQDGGFPDKPERFNRILDDVWPPTMRTWAEAAPYPFILAYQTTPQKWMPFKNQEDAVYDIGADINCRISDEHDYCNGPLRPVTNYRLKLRAFTTNGYQDSWTVPFTTPGESTAVYYLVLYSVLFTVLIAATGMYCILNERVPWAVKYRQVRSTTTTMESGLPADMNFKQLLAKSPQEIETEFNLLNVCLKLIPSADVALMPRNRSKNRYINTLPYDYNRVILRSNNNDYINASFIEDFNGIRKYIACQGPMKNTCIDMWQMVIDQDVASIVMLCQITEKEKIKCEKYFPNSKEKLIFGDIQVQNDIMIVDNNNSFTTRILTIFKGDSKKTIRHFQFHDWPDFGTPGDPSLLAHFCQVVQAKSPMGLIVVHCSAGVGRTGTYIACDLLWRQIQDRTKLNVFKMVLKLREQRTYMVQTQAQYEFVYEFLSYILKQNVQIKALDTEGKIQKYSSVNGTNTSSTKLVQT